MYFVIVGGENFLIHVDGQKRKVKFSTTALVDAENEKIASEMALGQIAQELSEMVLNDRSDPPQMLIEKIETHEGAAPKNLGAFEWSEQKEKDFVWVPKLSEDEQ